MNSNRVKKLENQLLAECERWYCRHCKESFWSHKSRRVKCPHCGAGLRSEMYRRRLVEYRNSAQALRLTKKAKV